MGSRARTLAYAQPIMTDLSIFQPVVSSAELSTVLAPLLDPSSLFALICVSKKIRKIYHKRFLQILKEENVPSRILRELVRELRRRQGLEAGPRRVFRFELNTMRVPQLVPSFHPTNHLDKVTIDCPVPNRERLQYFNPATYLKLTLDLHEPQNFYVLLTTEPTHPFILICLNDGAVLFSKRAFKNLPGTVIPAYEGEGEDPQVRTFMDEEWCIVLDLYGLRYVGRHVDCNGYLICEFRFHKTPHGAEHALILARDLVYTACDFPRLEVGDGGPA
jgi:hypothetical protein